MKARTRVLLMAIAAFVVLAMPKAALGVAWPSIAEDLGRALADLGVLIATYVAGYFISTLLNGDLNRRFGSGGLLTTAAVLAALSLAGMTLSPAWITLLAATLLLGASGGLIDASVNAHIAVGYGAKAMGFLHSGFGVGAVLGPLLMTALLALGVSWRIGFAAVALLQIIVAAGFAVDRGRWESSRPDSRSRRQRPQGRGATLTLSLLAFGVYTGIEIGAGEWSFSLLTEGRGIDDTVAGLAVAAFWGGLTVSRLALGLLGDRGRPNVVLGTSALGALGGLVLLWWNPSPWLGTTGLVITGLALGPYFPLQMLLTPRRFGAAYTPWMAGYQIAAASAGAAAIPGLIGLLVAVIGLEAVAPALALAAAALVIVTAVLRRAGSAVDNAPVHPEPAPS
jgi:fucose permease